MQWQECSRRYLAEYIRYLSCILGKARNVCALKLVGLSLTLLGRMGGCDYISFSIDRRSRDKIGRVTRYEMAGYKSTLPRLPSRHLLLLPRRPHASVIVIVPPLPSRECTRPRHPSHSCCSHTYISNYAEPAPRVQQRSPAFPDSPYLPYTALKRRPSLPTTRLKSLTSAQATMHPAFGTLCYLFSYPVPSKLTSDSLARA